MLFRSSPAGPHPATRPSESAGRHGLTLLEVLVSTAIFLMALVGIMQLISIGSNLAVETQRRTEALQMAQSKMSQVVLGSIPVGSAQSGDISKDETPNQTTGWSWDMASSQADISNPNLYNVRITVKHSSGVQVVLTQLILDPTQRGTNQIPSYISSGSSSGMPGSQ
jgi:type II secretion system protein I